MSLTRPASWSDEHWEAFLSRQEKMDSLREFDLRSAAQQVDRDNQRAELVQDLQQAEARLAGYAHEQA